MTRVTLGAGAPERTVEVELWDRVFVSRPVTRSISKRMRELEEQRIQAESDDEAMRAWAELMSLLTVPTNGQKKPAGQLILEKWEAEELSLGQIASFVEQLQDAALEARPT
jgi:hypothetical protein